MSGTGKRAGWLTSYIVACRGEDGKFLEIGMVSSGLKEKESEGPHNEKRQKNQERVNSEKVVSSEKKSINKNKQTREEP